MLTISFLLKEPKSKDTTLIYMFVFFGGKKPLKYSVSEKINKDHWNFDSQRVRVVRDCPNAKSINLKIERYERTIKDITLRLENENKSLSADLLKSELDIALKKVDAKDDNSDLISCYWKKVLEYKEKNTSNWKAYQTGFKLMSEFAVNKVYLFDDIDYLFFEDFINFLKLKNYTENYIGQQIKMLKTILNYSYKVGLHKNDVFRNIKKTSENIDNIYLTEEEILLIYNLLLTGYMERARDLFIIGCVTAMRYSDFVQIKPENIYDGFIHYVSQKTGEPTIVPVHWMIDELLEKYGGVLPRAISNQKLNDYLKEIGKLAGLESPVIKARTEGGKRIQRTYKKYELITTHTARRSAATNMYKRGMPTIAIMKITGHRTESAFMTYIKISKEENAAMLANNPYFKKNI